MGGKIYVVGGCTDTNMALCQVPLGSVEVLDPILGSGTPTNDVSQEFWKYVSDRFTQAASGSSRRRRLRTRAVGLGWPLSA